MSHRIAVAALLCLSCASDPGAPPTPADGAADASAEASTGPDAMPSDAGPGVGTDAGSGDAANAGRDVVREAAADAVVLCPAGMTWCGSFCSALDTVANCGGCGVSCCPPTGCTPIRGAFAVCARGTCAYACDRTHLDCDGITNGCEAEIGNANCGGCGRRCDPGTTCAEGLMCCPSGSGGAACRDAALRAREDAGVDAG